MDDFIAAAFEREHPGQWQEILPGYMVSVVSEGVGFVMTYTEAYLKFGAGVLSGVDLTADFLRDVARINTDVVIGSFYVSEGQENHWQLIFVEKVLRSWIDPGSRGSAQMLLDIVKNIPALVNTRAEMLDPKHGGRRWRPEPGWEMALVGHL